MNSKEIVNYLGSVHLLEDDTTAILNCIGKSGYLVIFGVDNLKICINTIGGKESRAKYQVALKEYFAD